MSRIADGEYVLATKYTDANPVLLDGLFYQVPQDVSATAAYNACPRTPASLSAQKKTTAALRWGFFDDTYTSSGPSWLGSLMGDGGVQAAYLTPGATTSPPTANTLFSNNIVKAAGSLSTPGASGLPTLLVGFNVNAATLAFGTPAAQTISFSLLTTVPDGSIVVCSGLLDGHLSVRKAVTGVVSGGVVYLTIDSPSDWKTYAMSPITFVIV